MDLIKKLEQKRAQCEADAIARAIKSIQSSMIEDANRYKALAALLPNLIGLRIRLDDSEWITVSNDNFRSIADEAITKSRDTGRVRFYLQECKMDYRININNENSYNFYWEDNLTLEKLLERIIEVLP